MTHTTVEPDESSRLENNVVDTLRTESWISSPEVESVMRAVPRHEFAPEATLEKVYEPYAVVITKTDEHGVQLSSVSAPQIQALMLEQARVRRGMRVLEIRSGGLNAAYLAELVGDDGEVPTADIDPVGTDRASRHRRGRPRTTSTSGPRAGTPSAPTPRCSPRPSPAICATGSANAAAASARSSGSIRPAPPSDQVHGDRVLEKVHSRISLSWQ